MRFKRFLKGLLGSLDFRNLETYVDCIKAKTTSTLKKNVIRMSRHIRSILCDRSILQDKSILRHFLMNIQDVSDNTSYIMKCSRTFLKNMLQYLNPQCQT